MKNYLYVIAVTFAVVSASCTKEEELPCRLSKSYYDGQLQQEYEYDAEGLLLKKTSYTNGNYDYDFNYVRNEDKTVKEIHIKNNGTMLMRSVLTYQQGRPLKTDIFMDDDNDGDLELIAYVDYEYYENGNMKKSVYHNPNAQTETFTYQWENGNIVRSDFEGGYYLFSYDDKPNPVKKKYFEDYDQLYGNVERNLSANNVVLLKRFNEEGISVYESSTLIGYNEYGLPTSFEYFQQDIVQEYEYECQ